MRQAQVTRRCKPHRAATHHDATTAAIITAAFELNIEPHRFGKMSGIGCSSKTTAYFMEGESDLTFDRIEALRDQYRGRLHEHRSAIAAAAQRLGWSFMTHRTDKPPQTALLALYASLSGEIANTTWNRV